jgi:hypothetical protein
MAVDRSATPFGPVARVPRWPLKLLVFLICILLVAEFLVSQKLIFPFDAPDERVHFARAYDVARAPGSIKSSALAEKVAVGSFFHEPQLVDDCYGSADCLVDPGRSMLSRLRLDQFFRPTALIGMAGSDNSFPYAGGNYLHLLPALLLAAPLHWSVLSAYWAARVSAGLIFLCVSAVLIALIRSQRASGFTAFFPALIGLAFWLPSSIFLSNSTSGDFLVTASAVLMSLFLLSSSWRLSAGVQRGSLAAQPLLYFIALGKLPYAPLVVAAAVLTWLRFRQARTGWFVAACFISFLFPLWWYVKSRHAVLDLFRSQRGEWVGVKLTTVQLLEWLQGSIFSVVSQFADLYRQMVAVFGNGPIARLFLPESFHLIHGFVLLVVLAAVIGTVLFPAGFQGKRLVGPLTLSRDASILLSAVMATYFMICYGLRLYWTNSYPLDGLQGRYFLPMLPFLVVALADWCSFQLMADGSSPDSFSGCRTERIFSILTIAVLALALLQLMFYLMNIFHFYSSSLLRGSS